MLGVVAGIDAFQSGRVDPFALHLVEKFGQRIGQIERGRLRRHAGFRRQKRGHHPRQLQLASQVRHRRGQRQRRQRVGGQVRHHAHARHKSRRPPVHQVQQRPPRPLRVHPDLDPRRRLGRLSRQPRVQAFEQRARKIHPWRQAEDARAVMSGKQARHSAKVASASAIPSGRPTSTQGPAWTIP
jgi:hypothetical protein